MHTTAQLQDLVKVVVVHAIGREAVVATGQYHGLIGSNALGFGERMQKFATKLKAGQSRSPGLGGHRLAGDDGVAEQLHFRPISVAQAAVCRGDSDTAVQADRAHVDVVDLQGVGVRVMASDVTLHLTLKAPCGVKRLDRKRLHEIVGLVPLLALHRRHLRHRRIAHQPPCAQGKQPHEGHRQVDGKLIPAVADHAVQAATPQAAAWAAPCSRLNNVRINIMRCSPRAARHNGPWPPAADRTTRALRHHHRGTRSRSGPRGALPPGHWLAHRQKHCGA